MGKELTRTIDAETGERSPVLFGSHSVEVKRYRASTRVMVYDYNSNPPKEWTTHG